MSLLPTEIHGKVFHFFLGEMLSECTRRATKLSDRKFNEPEKNIADYRHLRCREYYGCSQRRAANKRESSHLDGIDNETDDLLTLARCFPLRARM